MGPLRLAISLGLSLATTWPASGVQARSSDPRARDVSPARRIEPRIRDSRHQRAGTGPADMRSIDGSGNRLEDPEHNATFTALARTVPADYADGVSSLAGPGRRGAREVSNRVNAQRELAPNPYGTSDYLWAWGQFLDHDIDLTEGSDPPEPAPIPVPAGDAWFDPPATGVAGIPFNRSIHDPATGTDLTKPREQLNEVTGWIDGSQVYGSDAARAAALRTRDGTGRLITGPGGLLPDGDGSLPNATGGSAQVMFLAGDVRANEQLALTALHTLFVREHNRLADAIRREHPDLDGDAVYQRARRLVGALVQAITFEEFLPALLGPDALAPYPGYDPGMDSRIANEFSTAAFRLGHSALPPRLLRLDGRLREIGEGHVALRDAFFEPDRIRYEGGIEPLLRGLAHQPHQRIDLLVIDDVRNFLFGPPGEGGFDLAALNIQRGRDHGLGSYNDAREEYGLARVTRFADISTDPQVRSRLADAYPGVDDLDLWVGGLAEDPLPGSQVGPLFHAILVDQFAALRDGDRFWYERALDRRDLDRVRATRLADVIRRNTDIGSEIPDDVFRVASDAGLPPTGESRPRRGGRPGRR